MTHMSSFLGNSIYPAAARSLRATASALFLICMLFVVAACGSGSSSSSDDHYTDGNSVGKMLVTQMTDVKDQPLREVDCPNERLVSGDSIGCTAIFSDGSSKDFTVTISGFDESGNPQLFLDVP